MPPACRAIFGHRVQRGPVHKAGKTFPPPHKTRCARHRKYATLRLRAKLYRAKEVRRWSALTWPWTLRPHAAEGNPPVAMGGPEGLLVQRDHESGRIAIKLQSKMASAFCHSVETRFCNRDIFAC